MVKSCCLFFCYVFVCWFLDFLVPRLSGVSLLVCLVVFPAFCCFVVCVVDL